jgi:hypothetical protein
VDSTPYVATSLAGSIAYQKWGKPNPPYVVFKYVGKTWQRISLEEFPAEFREANVIINTKVHEKSLTRTPVPSEQIKELNSSLIKEYRTVLRTPLDHWKPHPDTDLVPTQNGWSSPDMIELRKKMRSE